MRTKTASATPKPPPTAKWIPNSKEWRMYTSAGLPDNQRKTTDPIHFKGETA